MKRWLLLLMFLAPATARSATPAASPTMADALAGVSIEQRLGESLPLDARFTDSTGRRMRLGDVFHGRPVLLTLVYFECPMLCTVTLNQLTRSLTALRESAGERFDIVTISIDARETPTLAAKKKAGYLHSYNRPSAADGWHFLTGDQTDIDRVAQAVGFHYRWDAGQQVFAHASALMVCTPEGKLSRYFLGVDYPPTEVRAALNAADVGAVAPPAEAVYFYCLKYDPQTGKYGLLIGRTLRLLGAATLVGVAGLIVGLQRMHTRRPAPLVPEGAL